MKTRKKRRGRDTRENAKRKKENEDGVRTFVSRVAEGRKRERRDAEIKTETLPHLVPR